MYVCGMTVYDYCHIGHARVMMAFDMVQRWLRASGYDVNYVRNITDIDDKIIKRAVENNETIAELTARFIAVHGRGHRRARHASGPTSSRARPTMCRRCWPSSSRLEKKGLAYKADDGDVNYAVRNFEGYGKLSGKSLDDLRAGERVDVNTGKRDPLDFVLWKSSQGVGARIEVKWASQMGQRPARLAYRMLGDVLRVAGRAFRHPRRRRRTCSFRTTRTRSPSRKARSASTIVNYWMHNGFVRVDNEKMSKSLGNFFTIREVLKKLRCRSGALLHPARPLPQPAQLFRCPPGRCAQAR